MFREANYRPPGASSPRDPPTESLLFYLLYARYLHLIQWHLRYLPPDDREDITIEFWLGVWQDLQAGKFRYQGDKETQKWLLNRLAWRERDYRRKQARKPIFVSLDEPIEQEDGAIDLGEILPAKEDDSEDENLREYVIELAEQCLHNEQQIELVRCRMRGLPLPKEWSASWVNTTWHRITEKLLNAYRNKD